MAVDIAALRIVEFPAPILRARSKPLPAVTDEVRAVARRMIDLMHEAEGIGLAAQQIGQAIQFCVVDLRPVEAKFDWELDGRKPPLDLCMPMAIANPKITVLPGEKTSYEEGCLSFPGIRGDVIRPDAIRVDFQDLDGTAHVLVCTGLLSRCIQQLTGNRITLVNSVKTTMAKR